MGRISGLVSRFPEYSFYKRLEATMKRCLLCEKTIYAKNLCSYHYRKKWCEENKEHVAKTKKEWANNNKDKITLANKKWKERNKDYFKSESYKKKNNERLKKWQKKNRKKATAYWLKRYHSSKEFRKKQYARRLARSVCRKEACELCTSKERLERHHPDYNKPREVITLCKACHTKIHNK